MMPLKSKLNYRDIFYRTLSATLILGQVGFVMPTEAKKKSNHGGAEGNLVKPKTPKNGAEGNRSIQLASLVSTPLVLANYNQNNNQNQDRTEEGRRDGQAAGRNDGRRDGQAKGRQEGYRKGYRVCEEDEERKAYDRGYREGSLDGRQEGQRKGRWDGAEEGRQRGYNDGYRDGKGRADNDARSAAYPRGRDQGFDEADRSDARERGREDGIREGDERAWADAYAAEYPRGRADYRQQRWDERIENNDTIDFAPALAAVASVEAESAIADSAFALFGSAELKGFPQDMTMGRTTMQNVSPQNDGGYQEAYNRAYKVAYRNAYQNAYNNAYGPAQQRGCAEARSKNYGSDYRRGKRRGYDDAYQVAYRRSYDRAYDREYGPSYSRASNEAYNEWYDTFYDRHFEAARSEAYRERYNDLYRAHYDPAFRETYDAKYPGYASRAYDMGVADETEDFRLRPVRMLEGVRVVETIPNGVFEPGEELKLDLSMRNFADSSLDGSDIQITIYAMDGNKAVLDQATVTLPRNLRKKSVTEVLNALSFRMTDMDKDKVASFGVNLSYKGRAVGSERITVNTQYLLKMEFESDPRLQEGIMSPLFVKVTNRGNIPMEGGTVARLDADSELVEFASTEQALPRLSAGQSTVLEYRALVRSSAAMVNIPFVMESTLPSGRRVSAVDLTTRVPLMNDYRVGVVSSTVVAELKKTGAVRVPYRIKNISSRLLFKGLQLKVRFKSGADNNSHMVIGPNPQYITPLQKGQVAEFMIPVIVKKEGVSGTLELEVQEDGQTVVIHHLEF